MRPSRRPSRRYHALRKHKTRKQKGGAETWHGALEVKRPSILGDRWEAMYGELERYNHGGGALRLFAQESGLLAARFAADREAAETARFAAETAAFRFSDATDVADRGSSKRSNRVDLSGVQVEGHAALLSVALPTAKDKASLLAAAPGASSRVSADWVEHFEQRGTVTRGFWVNCVAFSPDGTRFAVGGLDKKLALYETPT